MDGTAALAVLGLAPGASASQIKAAFRATAKLVHPDHLGAPDEFLALRQAYEVATAGARAMGREADRIPGRALDGPDVAGSADPATVDGHARRLHRHRTGRWLVDLTRPTATVDVLDVARPPAARPVAGRRVGALSFADHLAEALAA